ncbi:general odorant-binding protein 72-like isoform X2 [Daktulosphaira vitifoliae]|nr:general odorant-binding protein 72-like isoform X2 [Daktulosphaira vitifoliae]XP_050544052.1 general odorant-binding protein 72-like isoform X2 [Daktulosphaira vitifoliae]
MKNASQECLSKNHVTIERVVALYSINTEDHAAKCYVSCMLNRFNVTNEKGEYNEKALKQMMKRRKTQDISSALKENIDKCTSQANDVDSCEKAVQFTKCLYSNKQEMGIDNGNQMRPPQSMPPIIPFSSIRPRFPNPNSRGPPQRQQNGQVGSWRNGNRMPFNIQSPNMTENTDFI